MNALANVAHEIDLIREKWGDHDYGDPVMLAVLVEEVGEVARHLQPDSPTAPDALRIELVQVAAVAARWADMIGRRECIT